MRAAFLLALPVSAFFAVLPPPAAADGAQPASSSVGFTLGSDRLDNGSPDWHESTVRVDHTFSPRRVVELAVTRTERFGLRDTQLAALYAMPLSPLLTATIEATASSTHHVLAKQAAGATLQYEFAPAWLLHGGIRSTGYDDARVNQGLLMLEHYIGSFSWSAGWRPSRAFGTTAHGAELRGSYYYGDRDSVGIILAGGKEAASIGGSVALSNVRSAALVGRHWLNRDWALNYSAGHVRQGDFYDRNGVSLGLQYAF